MSKQWDQTFAENDELSASQWNRHVSDQKSHSARHENGGSDELNVAGLSGQLSDKQLVEIASQLVDTLSFDRLLSTSVSGSTATLSVATHSNTHEVGGEDELSVEGLSGDLADAQDPKEHSTDHGFGGADELATALRYEPQSEPGTPTSGCVRWYDEIEDAYKVKFDNGESITVGAK